MSLLTFRKNIQIKIDDRVAHRSSETYEERQRFGDFSVLKLGLKLKIRNPIAENELWRNWIAEYGSEIEEWNSAQLLMLRIQLQKMKSEIQREIENLDGEFIDELSVTLNWWRRIQRAMNWEFIVAINITIV